MSNVVIEKGFFIETPNQAGAASEFTSFISEGGNNFKGLWASVNNNKGQLFFVPENFAGFKKVIGNSSFTNIQEQDFVVVKTADQQGTCSTFFSKLANAGINVTSFWTTTFENQPAVVFCTDNNAQAAKIIG